MLLKDSLRPPAEISETRLPLSKDGTLTQLHDLPLSGRVSLTQYSLLQRVTFISEVHEAFSYWLKRSIAQLISATV